MNHLLSIARSDFRCYGRTFFQISVSVVIVLTLLHLGGCTKVQSHLTECRYEVEKLFANEKTPSELGDRLERDLKVGTLMSKCMEARGFAFNSARSNENSAKKRYSGIVDSVMDDGNWDPSWLANFTHKESK